eukprot:2448594-Prymnesium_polylepis.1
MRASAAPLPNDAVRQRRTARTAARRGSLRLVRAPPPGVCRPHPGHPGWVVRPCLDPRGKAAPRA